MGEPTAAASDVRDRLALVLDAIDRGEIDATTAQRAYIAGARDAIGDLGQMFEPPGNRLVH